MVRRVAVAACLFALAGAAGAGAQTPPPAAAPSLPPASVTYPPPSPMDEAGIRAWVKSYIDVGPWRLVGADPSAASFRAVAPPQVGADGLVSSEVRREYYGGPEGGPLGALSVRQAWIVDCKGKQVWVRKIMLFSDNNLKGQSQGRETPEPRWTELSSGSINEKIMAEICAAAASVKPPPEPVKSPT